LTPLTVTVNVHTSGTISGTYQCMMNASSPTRRPRPPGRGARPQGGQGRQNARQGAREGRQAARQAGREGRQEARPPRAPADEGKKQHGEQRVEPK
jgi:hypothetical protein